MFVASFSFGPDQSSIVSNIIISALQWRQNVDKLNFTVHVTSFPLKNLTTAKPACLFNRALKLKDTIEKQQPA